jgi:hypothetical protein
MQNDASKKQREINEVPYFIAKTVKSKSSAVDEWFPICVSTFKPWNLRTVEGLFQAYKCNAAMHQHHHLLCSA